MLRDALTAVGVESVLDLETASLAEESGGVPAKEMAEHVDVAAVIGGDGTVLHAVSRLGIFDKPVAGINIGRLGFLTTCKETEIVLLAKALSEGKFDTTQRTMLEAEVVRQGKEKKTFTALNEITLARGDTGRLVSVSAEVDGDLLNRYRADGIIVSTPTGSTAYSLSAGGPLVSPAAGVFLITPICPHSLSQRALVLSDSSTVELSSNEDETGPMLFTVDGRESMSIQPGDRIRVKKSSHCFSLLRLEGASFYEALRVKLGWQGV